MSSPTGRSSPIADRAEPLSSTEPTDNSTLADADRPTPRDDECLDGQGSTLPAPEGPGPDREDADASEDYSDAPEDGPDGDPDHGNADVPEDDPDAPGGDPDGGDSDDPDERSESASSGCGPSEKGADPSYRAVDSPAWEKFSEMDEKVQAQREPIIGWRTPVSPLLEEPTAFQPRGIEGPGWSTFGTVVGMMTSDGFFLITHGGMPTELWTDGREFAVEDVIIQGVYKEDAAADCTYRRGTLRSEQIHGLAPQAFASAFGTCSRWLAEDLKSGMSIDEASDPERWRAAYWETTCEEDPVVRAVFNSIGAVPRAVFRIGSTALLGGDALRLVSHFPPSTMSAMRSAIRHHVSWTVLHKEQVLLFGSNERVLIEYFHGKDGVPEYAEARETDGPHLETLRCAFAYIAILFAGGYTELTPEDLMVGFTDTGEICSPSLMEVLDQFRELAVRGDFELREERAGLARLARAKPFEPLTAERARAAKAEWVTSH